MSTWYLQFDVARFGKKDVVRRRCTP